MFYFQLVFADSRVVHGTERQLNAQMKPIYDAIWPEEWHVFFPAVAWCVVRRIVAPVPEIIPIT